MSEANRKTKLSALLIASLISANFVWASDSYKNNVVDVRVNKEAGDAVKVTIYTDRPYTDPVVVNKKANNKYVILMPETNSVLRANPTVTNGAGTISNVTVNTQAVSGGKGYTKIIITSEKAINVVPRTQQVTGAKPVVKPTTTTTKLSTDKPVTTSSKPAQTTAQKTADKQKQEQAKKAAQQKVQQQPKKTVASQPTQPVKPQVKQIQPTTQKVAQAEKKQPIEILEQEIKTGQYASVVPDSHDEVLNKEINNNLANDDKVEKRKSKLPVFDANNNDKTVVENIKSVLRGYKNISIWKMLLLAGAITFPIIVIFVILTMDKKINKKIDKSFKREEEERYTVEPPEAYEDTSSQPDVQVYNSFDDMLDKVDEPEISYHNEQLAHTEFEEFTEALEQQDAQNLDFVPVNEQVSEQEFNNDFELDDFEAEPESEDVEVIQETPITPEIVDELPIEETVEPEIPEEPQLPAEPYNPDGYLSDFEGVNNPEINDKEFFDELVMQTMADNNSDGLPPESPADEVFNFMSEDEPQQPVEPIVDTPDVTTPVVSASVVDEQAQTVEPEEPQYEHYSDGDDELTMLKEVKLNDNAGMYLVNYDNFSSLVGHIDDEYFVIKKFDEMESGRIFVKETEKLKDVRRYLVRVGRNKMVVEVSDTSMTKLMDL